MSTGIHLILANKISDDALVEIVKHFVSNEGVEFFSQDNIVVGNAQLWLSETSLSDLGYEDEELDEIVDKLKSEPSSFFLLEFNDDTESCVLALKLASLIADKERLILDDCNGGLFDRNGIFSLLERGYI